MALVLEKSLVLEVQVVEVQVQLVSRLHNLQEQMGKQILVEVLEEVVITTQPQLLRHRVALES